MKRCPNCKVNYSDDTLEFCLEDGARLILLTNLQTDMPPVTVPPKPHLTTDKTVNLSFSEPTQNLGIQGATNLQTTPQTALFKEKVVQKTNKVLEVAPVVISLAQNWWQWLYLDNQSYSTFSTYFLSSNFLVWLLLLVSGAAVGLFALRRSQNKGFAITSLVILAVNLILFLVPRR